MIRNNSLALLFLLIFITVGIVSYCQYPSLKDKLLYHCDINLYFPPVYSLKDPALFTDDYLIQYSLFQIPKGYLGLFLFMSNLFDLILLAKILPFILSIVSVVYFFLIGKEIKDKMAGFIMSLLFILHSWTFHTFQGMTPRAFLYPLFLPFIYCLLKKKYLTCFFLFLTQIFFYPPAAVISFITLFFSGLSINKRRIHTKPHLAIFILFFLSLLVFYFLQFPANMQKQFGPVVSLKDMRGMAEFYPGGKEPIFFPYLWQFLISPRVGIDLSPSLAFLFAISTGFLLLISRKSKNLYVPKEIRAILISGPALYLFSYMVFFNLYFPARYIMYTLPLFLSFIVGIAFSGLLENVKKSLDKNITVIIFIGFTTLFYLPIISGRLSHNQYLREAVEFISTTPKDSIIVSTPSISDPVPTFAKRKILFSRRLLIPFQKRYYETVKKRVFDFYRAYYAGSDETVKNFCSRYSVDYVVLNKQHFSKNYLKEDIREDEPFKTFIASLTRGRDDFVLMKLAKDRTVFEKGDIIIMKTSDFR